MVKLMSPPRTRPEQRHAGPTKEIPVDKATQIVKDMRNGIMS